jgi:hypothetical protein
MLCHPVGDVNFFFNIITYWFFTIEGRIESMHDFASSSCDIVRLSDPVILLAQKPLKKLITWDF